MIDDDESRPATEPFGLLQLPPIQPPTAVGLGMAPRPPRPGRYPARLTRVRRVALGLLALLLWGGAVALLSPIGLRVVGAIALMFAGTYVALRALSASEAPLRLLASNAVGRTRPRSRGTGRGTHAA
jgi:hypothetical protein